MSKVFKRIAALLLTVALLSSGIVPAFATQISGPNPEEERGSITVTRIIGEPRDPDLDSDSTNFAQPGVPISIRRVTLNNGVVPTAEQLNTPDWSDHVEVIGEPIFRVTDEHGVAYFGDLELGIWLVMEEDTAEIDYTTFENPLAERFNNFLVGIPRWVDDEHYPETGEWEFDVRVYPKSELEEDPNRGAISC